MVNASRELPAGWMLVRIADIGANEKYAIVDGPFGSMLKVSDYVQDGVIPVVSISNIDEGFSREQLRYISEEKFQQIKRSAVKAGDILVAKIGSSYGKVGYYPNWMPVGIIPANLLKITVSEKVNKAYVYYYLKSSGFKKLLDKITKSTAQPAFNVSAFRELPIPLPPFTEQKQIVAKIEELFTQLEAGMSALERVQAGLRRYKASVLKAAVSGKLGITYEVVTEQGGLPEGWQWVKLNDVTKKITDGTHFTPTYVESGVAFISVKDIYGGRVNFDSCKFIPQEEHDQLIKRCHPEPPDVLITKSGTIGRIAVVKTDQPFSLFVSVALIKPLPEFWESDYLAIVLENYINHLDIKQNVKGGVIKNLHVEDIRKITLPLPPLEEQRRIVAEVERRLSVAGQVESAVEEALVRASRLRQAVLRSAFEGRLT
jgi:type I restriction enzyme, S subunit